MNPDVFITICFASIVAVLSGLGAWAVVLSVRGERRRAPRER